MNSFSPFGSSFLLLIQIDKCHSNSASAFELHWHPTQITYWLDSNVSDAFKSCQDSNQIIVVVEANHACTDLIRIVRMHSNRSTRGHSNYVRAFKLREGIQITWVLVFALISPHSSSFFTRWWQVPCCDRLFTTGCTHHRCLLFFLVVAAAASARRSALSSSSSSSSCIFPIIGCMYLPWCIYPQSAVRSCSADCGRSDNQQVW